MSRPRDFLSDNRFECSSTRLQESLALRAETSPLPEFHTSYKTKTFGKKIRTTQLQYFYILQFKRHALKPRTQVNAKQTEIYYYQALLTNETKKNDEAMNEQRIS